MQRETKIVFLWHMHQPYYKFPDKELYYLPWVRLRGVKDYYGMARILDKFEHTKVVFNFSGVLIEQIVGYTQKGLNDYYYFISLKDPKYLEKKEIEFIQSRFFTVNIERIIRKSPRYLHLYEKQLSKQKFTLKDLRDLQVWFNLSWFHPYTIKEDKNIQDLIKKDKDFTEEEKKYVLEKQMNIMKEILPLYKRLQEEKRIEISFTPYYHVIMPLIYDTDVLNDFPYLKKPKVRFSYPKDCLWHIDKAIDIINKELGVLPLGSWPAEGSVSEDVLKIYKSKDVKWLSTDEEILFKSLATDYVPYEVLRTQRHSIYQPYEFSSVKVFFRDRNLSDMISFVYQGWEDSVFAARDLLEHFKRIHNFIQDKVENRVITIAMDGENAWEYYKNNGVDFLETMYSEIEKSDMFSTDLPSHIISIYDSKPLKKFMPGSWINGDFGVWIGSEKNNKNWEILARLREKIEEKKEELKENYQRAKELFYIIEGSDWNWWNTFEDTHKSFENLFFLYVKEICRIIKEPVTRYINQE